MLMVKKRVISTFPAFFLSILLAACTPAPANQESDAMTRLENLCSGGNHEACIRQAETALSTYENDGGNAADVQSIADIYKMLAEAAERSGDTDGAVAYWSDMLKKYESDLSDARNARIRLNMAGILARAGRYTDALAAYGDISNRYADIFPESFAGYAREAAGDIESTRVVRITGRATALDDAGRGGIVIRAFNGFEESYTEADLSGTYSLPLYASTPGTRFCLYVYRQGCRPDVSVHNFDGTATIELEDVTLAPVQKAMSDAGMAMGVVYSTIRGGKTANAHGIAGLRQQPLTFIRQHEGDVDDPHGENEIISTASDENGVYEQWLPPGVYLMRTEGAEKEVLVKSGQFCINNIESGTHRID